jgi:hypothetical protein
MKKFLAALVMAAFVLLAVASVSWGNEAGSGIGSDGGTWEGIDLGGTWE